MFFLPSLPCFLIRTLLSACAFVCTGVPVPPSRLLRLDVFTTIFQLPLPTNQNYFFWYWYLFFSCIIPTTRVPRFRNRKPWPWRMRDPDIVESVRSTFPHLRKGTEGKKEGRERERGEKRMHIVYCKGKAETIQIHK